MFNLKKEAEEDKVRKAGCNQMEWELFRYIICYGDSGTQYTLLTPKKNYPLLSVFEYVLPNEIYLKVQQIVYYLPTK